MLLILCIYKNKTYNLTRVQGSKKIVICLYRLIWEVMLTQNQMFPGKMTWKFTWKFSKQKIIWAIIWGVLWSIHSGTVLDSRLRAPPFIYLFIKIFASPYIKPYIQMIIFNRHNFPRIITLFICHNVNIYTPQMSLWVFSKNNALKTVSVVQIFYYKVKILKKEYLLRILFTDHMLRTCKPIHQARPVEYTSLASNKTSFGSCLRTQICGCQELGWRSWLGKSFMVNLGGVWNDLYLDYTGRYCILFILCQNCTE